MSIDIDKIRRSVGIIGESEQIHDMLTTIGQVAGTDIIVKEMDIVQGDWTVQDWWKT